LGQMKRLPRPWRPATPRPRGPSQDPNHIARDAAAAVPARTPNAFSRLLWIRPAAAPLGLVSCLRGSRAQAGPGSTRTSGSIPRATSAGLRARSDRRIGPLVFGLEPGPRVYAVWRTPPEP